jgi:hypothetical protein
MLTNPSGDHNRLGDMMELINDSLFDVKVIAKYVKL